MSTIMISILPEGMPVDRMESTEDGESCPLPTQDEELNTENMNAAEDEYSYSKCTNVDKCCATCSMYNQTDEIKECIEDDSGDTGYCQLLKFVCKSENTCSEWVEGESITSNPQEEYKDIL